MRYRQDVEARAFPTATHSPYKIAQQQRADLARQAREGGLRGGCPCTGELRRGCLDAARCLRRCRSSRCSAQLVCVCVCVWWCGGGGGGGRAASREMRRSARAQDGKAILSACTERYENLENTMCRRHSSYGRLRCEFLPSLFFCKRLCQRVPLPVLHITASVLASRACP